MCSSRSNLLTNYNFTGGTEIGKRGPLLVAKISSEGLILEGDRNFCYSPLHTPIIIKCVI